MGKIFGISDLPVTTIMSAFEPISVPAQKVVNTTTKVGKNALTNDVVVIKAPKTQQANPVIKKRFGIGRLMNSQSKVEDK